MKKLMFLVVSFFGLLSFAQAGDTCIVEIKTGWNLVGSSNLKLFAEIAQSSSAEIISAWKWNKSSEKWEFFEPTKPYYGQVYAKEKGYLFFAEAKPGEGYWINAKSSGVINTCAEQLPPSPPV